MTFSSHVFFTERCMKKKSLPCYKTTACIRHSAGCDLIWNLCFLGQVIFQSISLHMPPPLFQVQIRQQPNYQLLCVPQLAQLLFWRQNCKTLSARFKIIYLHTDFSLLHVCCMSWICVFITVMSAYPSGKSLSNNRLQSTTCPPVPIRSLDWRLTIRRIKELLKMWHLNVNYCYIWKKIGTTWRTLSWDMFGIFSPSHKSKMVVQELCCHTWNSIHLTSKKLA